MFIEFLKPKCGSQEDAPWTSISGDGTSRSQNFIMSLHKDGFLFLNKDAIESKDQEDYDSTENTYYLYIGENRYKLGSPVIEYVSNPPSTGNCPTAPSSGTNILFFTGFDFSFNAGVGYNIWLARETNKKCFYYK